LRLAESFAGEGLADLAGEAYAEAGARLAARKEFEPARDAFTRALALRPDSHAALHGMLTAHAALGTPDEAAEVLEQVVAQRPGDLEVRAMLARAYVEAEDAARAEAATHELVGRDPSSFMLLFDVARLYLRAGNTEDATRLLARVADPALAARQEPTLAEILQEVLARNPEQLEAHRLLVRTHASSHDDAKLRAALERLADAAEATGAVEDERRALTRLARLAPDDQAALARLEELGGPLFEEGDAPAPAEDAPTFERFMLGDDAPASQPAPPTAAAGGAEFEWNSVAEPQAAPAAEDASASFADLNDLTDGGEGAAGASPVPQYEPPQSGFQEFDLSARTPAADNSESSAGRMLRQELESVEFYIEQGYADIARDTLDMLERQYGAHEQIDAFRARVASADEAAAAAASGGPPAFNASANLGEPAAFDPSAFDLGAGFDAHAPAGHEAADAFDASAFEMPAVSEETAASAGFDAPANFETPAAQEPPRPAAGNNSAPREAGGGIDPGLAAIFDEFREAVEDGGDEESGGDFDTHYQMGLAYREMGLLDQAVEEFQAAAGLAAPGDGTPRFLQCCNMLGHCFMEKGMPRPAALWFKKGLDSPGHTEDEYQAIRFDLGTAYEQMGDTRRAIDTFTEVYGIDVTYRGVADRLRELQQHESQQHETVAG
ncbi:MAG TPA: tetratricopeptide repeat protein, partial [Pyrinomonadaceae bacterium]